MDQKTRELNEFFIESICGRGKGTPMQKRAEETATSYIRKQIYEGSFYNQILPQVKIDNSDLNEDITSRKPYKIVEIEPRATGAMTVQFGTLPNSLLMEAEKIPVYFNRIQSQMYIKDVDELRTIKMDIRQILCDQQVKQMEWELDRRFIYAVNDAITLPYDTNRSANLKVNKMFEKYSDGLTREAFIDSTNIMRKSSCHLSPNKVLLNTITYTEFLKWGFEEHGGDKSQQVLYNGSINDKLMGLDISATIKRELIPDGRVYYFAEPKFLGRNYILEDPTMWVRNEAYWVQWFMYQTVGGCIANLEAVACADFDPDAMSGGATSPTVSLSNSSYADTQIGA